MPRGYHQAKKTREEASATVPRLLSSHRAGKKALLEIRGVRGHSTQGLISSTPQSPNPIQDFKTADVVAAYLWKILRGWYYLKMYMCVQSFWLCPIPRDPVDCSPSGSSVHGILQARMLQWVAMLSSRGSSWPGLNLNFFCLLHHRQILYHWATREALCLKILFKLLDWLRLKQDRKFLFLFYV